MTVGISVTTANAMLLSLGNPYIQLHTGDPGVDGTSNIAIVSTRMYASLKAPVNGVCTLTSAMEWSPWSGGKQTVTHLSAWSAATAGTFLFSIALTSSAEFPDGMIPRLSALSVSIPSLAAN